MSGNGWATLVAAIFAATVGLTGCSQDTARQLDSADSPAATSTTLAAPNTAALPPPEALADVLSRLADPAVPGNDKLNLVQDSTPDTAAAVDKFTTALRDGGYLPMTFTVNSLAWSTQDPSAVTATVVVATAHPDRREFTFPMEFTTQQGAWQLSHKTAEMLLAMQNSNSSTSTTPGPTPGPAPGPGPAPSETAAPSPAPSPGSGPPPSSTTPSGSPTPGR